MAPVEMLKTSRNPSERFNFAISRYYIAAAAIWSNLRSDTPLVFGQCVNAPYTYVRIDLSMCANYNDFILLEGR